jgi:hypothetical protein
VFRAVNIDVSISAKHGGVDLIDGGAANRRFDIRNRSNGNHHCIGVAAWGCEDANHATVCTSGATMNMSAGYTKESDARRIVEKGL